MRIYSKNALKFNHPSNQEAPVVVRALDFADVPDWVVDSTMFKLATVGENPVVTVIESRAQESQTEKKARTKASE